MKKKLIAVAIATAFAAPAFADNSNVTVYGKINLDVETINTNAVVAQRSKTQPVNNASRFGVKGTEDLGDGLSTIWQLEAQVDPSGNSTTGSIFDGTRNSNIGLKGNFGTVFVGNWDTPYKVSHNKVELFDNAGSFSSLKLLGSSMLKDKGNAGKAISYATRQKSVLQYWTPKMGDISAAVAISRITSANTTDVTQTSLSGTYDNGAFYAALAYENRPDQSVVGKKDTATRLVGAYNFGAALVGLTYERLSTGAATATLSQNNWELSGKYTFGNSTIGAFYAKAGDITGDAAHNAAANESANMFSLRYGYSFSKRTELWAAYSQLKNDANGTYGFSSTLAGFTTANSKQTGTAVGLSHTF